MSFQTDIDVQVHNTKDKAWLLRKASGVLSDRQFLALRFFLRFKKWPNLKNPSMFNERVLALILSRDQAPLRKRIADKLGARALVEKTVGAGYLSTVYQVADRFSDLNWAELPDRFVLKTNHGWRQVLFVDNKNTADIGLLKATTDEWLQYNHYRHAREYVYADIKPKIYAEELYTTSDGTPPNDVKVYVFRGKVRVVRINENMAERNYNEVYYDRHWNRLPFWTPHYSKLGDIRTPGHDWARPKRLDDMIEVAERISPDFSFIRVDFCDLGDRIIVTELTNFPASGNDPIDPPEFEHIFGALFTPPDQLSAARRAELEFYFPPK